ncbi:outer membrane beta-barrel protein [Vibrio vulnificus]|uniref:outer membrane beta-barrel protein n=1 Tax=Vibrio vulnificus TaxID=672 RepID=UPI001A1A842D|nr:outer membrane beta-barrel protein [Vibrio vulnificus]HAS6222313.1 outer membrane beta-barrel protein [Vibrio vulnificus]
MKISNLTVLFFFTSSPLSAEQDSSNVSIGGGASISVLEQDTGTNNDEYLGYEFFIGYKINDFISLESGYHDYNIPTLSSNWFSRLKASVSVSDYASLYLSSGVGWSDDSLFPSVGFGIKYDVSKDFLLDVGYQYTNEIGSNGYSSTAFMLLMVYNFPNSSQYKEVLKYKGVDKDVDKGFGENYIQDKEFISGDLCHVGKVKYIVKEGDWLRKIAREHGMSYDLFMEYNYTLFQRDNIDLVYPGELVTVLSKCKS